MNDSLWGALALSLGLQGIPTDPPEVQKAGGPSVAFMSALTGGTGLFDLATTLQGINTADGKELNPIARPFMNAGPIPALGYLAGTTALQAILAKELKNRGKSYWWVPQAATSGLHILAGLLNRRK